MLPWNDDEKKLAVQAKDYMAIRWAAENGHIDTIIYLETHLTPAERKEAVKANNYQAILWAAEKQEVVKTASPKAIQKEDGNMPNSAASKETTIQYLEEILRQFKIKAPLCNTTKAQRAFERLDKKLIEQLKTLKNNKEKTFPEALDEFKKQSIQAIEGEKHNFKHDITWSTYLLNLVKQIANAVIGFFSSNKASFFKIKHSDTVNSAAEELKRTINSTKPS